MSWLTNQRPGSPAPDESQHLRTLLTLLTWHAADIRDSELVFSHSRDKSSCEERIWEIWESCQEQRSGNMWKTTAQLRFHNGVKVVCVLSWPIAPIASYSPPVSSFLYKLDTGIGFVFLRSNKYITVFRLGQIAPIANRNLYLVLFAYGLWWDGAGSNSDSSDISGSDPMMISLYPLGVESNNKEDSVWRVARARGHQGSIRDVQFWFIGPLSN